MVEASRKILIKYTPEDVGPSFWQELYGYSKGNYEYPGLLDDVPGAERLAETLIAVPEGDAERVKNFLKEQGAEFEEMGSITPKPETGGVFLRWDDPKNTIRKSLEGLGGEMDDLGPFIRTESKRSALKDVERYGY